MADEQSVPDSDASVIDRMTAYVSGTPEGPPSAESQEPATQEPETADPQVEEQPQEAETFEFQDDDGEVIPLPKKLEARVKSWAEFTKTKQEVTTLRQQAEDRMQYAQASAQVNAAVAAASREHAILEYQAQLAMAEANRAVQVGDTNTALMKQFEANRLEVAAREKADAIRQYIAQSEAAWKHHSTNQWSKAEEAAANRLGRLSDAENVALAKQVQTLGFELKEFKERYADPRVIHAIHKAAKYDALMAKKPSAVTAVQKAPPVLKPGASQGQSAANAQKYKSERDELKRTGSEAAAAKLLARFK